MHRCKLQLRSLQGGRQQQLRSKLGTFSYFGNLIYTQPLVLPAAFALYASVSVTTTAGGAALVVTAYGGAY